MNVIVAWQNIIGIENVITDISTISAVQVATFMTTQSILAVITPQNLKQVQMCVVIANQYKTPIYPISCGKNWGLGSKVPVQSNCAIMDLSKLNKILDFNEKLAYITVEPGVSFRQVAKFLQEKKSNLFVSKIGGSSEASLIGNILERGDGSGYYGERFNYVSGFEVVLPIGKCIHTGFKRFASAKNTNVHRGGVGPYLDGIFTQSNLGIVTKMTIWLMPKPKYFQVFRCVINDTYHLEKLIDILQKLMLQEVIKNNGFNLWNYYKLLAKETQYTSLIESTQLESWLGIGEVYSSSLEIGLAKRKIIEQSLKGLVEKFIFIDSDTDSHLIDERLSSLPDNTNIKSTYWRKKQKIPIQMNPDRDKCGVIWLCPAISFEGHQVVEALQIIESTVKSYQFEPNIAMTCTSGRNIHMFLAIMYDREIEGEDERAMKCHDQTLQLLTQKGYIPCRLGIQSMNSLPPAKDDYGHLIATLKQALDPNNILSPGRYDFRSEWSNEKLESNSEQSTELNQIISR